MRSFDRFDSKYGKRFRVIHRSKEESDKITQQMRQWLQRKEKRIRYTLHALEMCDERAIDRSDVEHVLLTGRHIETREYEDKVGRYRENFEGLDQDQAKRLCIVTREESNILIITVIDI